jgi:hypothetical protein
MKVKINQLVKSLLRKDSIEDCSLQEVQQFADQHPYFGAAQLLLAKKLQTENSSQYSEQLEKTSLFFHNPLWLERLLNETTGTAEVTNPVPEVTANIPAPVLPEIKSEPVVVFPEKNIEQTEMMVNETAETLPVAEETPLHIPGLKIEPIDPAKAEMIFEPYHTVDYFASQGINLKEEEKPMDKFGQQLKSFTDWLKLMKKLPVTEITKTIAPMAEQKVEQMAAHSLEERDIFTETMAEVWEKQGNSEKAAEVYRKLSLLDPSKSAYFAAKIEDLKKK